MVIIWHFPVLPLSMLMIIFQYTVYSWSYSHFNNFNKLMQKCSAVAARMANAHASLCCCDLVQECVELICLCVWVCLQSCPVLPQFTNWQYTNICTWQDISEHGWMFETVYVCLCVFVGYCVFIIIEFVCYIDTGCTPFSCLTSLLSWSGGNTDSVFDVEKAVGTIIIAKPLDAEQHSFYNLTVQATDGSNTAYTQVQHNRYFTNCLLFGGKQL